MKQGIISTKIGKKISSKNPLDWNINSDYPMFKVHSITRGTLTNSAVTIPHNLNYYPIVMVWLGYNGEFWYMQPDAFSYLTSVTVTDTDVVIWADGMDYICYIFYDES